MKELKDYDLAANKFYGRQQVNLLPIISGDFYKSHSERIGKRYHDLAYLSKLAKSNQWAYHTNLEEQLIDKDHIIVVTDTTLKIVHATHNIINMNGYTPEEVIGHKPKMFQGTDTCKETTAQIAIAVRNKLPFEAVIVNYRKNGSAYKCWIKGEPIFDKVGEVINFIAFERAIA